MAQRRGLSLAGRIFLDKEMPSRAEIVRGAGRAIKDTIKAPVKTIKEGIARDKAAVQAFRMHTGKTRGKAAKEALRSVGTGAYKGGGKDLLVNTGGVVGSVVGSQAGLPGKLAGDYLGARGTRKVLDVAEEFANNRGVPLRDRARKVRDILVKPNRELAEDAIGWGVGNAVGEAVGIPLSGASTALPGVPSVIDGWQKARQTFKETRNRRQALRDGAATAGTKFKERVNAAYNPRSGVKREQKMYQAVNEQLKNLPDTPDTLRFSYSYRPLIFFPIQPNHS